MRLELTVVLDRINLSKRKWGNKNDETLLRCIAQAIANKNQVKIQ